MNIRVNGDEFNNLLIDFIIKDKESKNISNDLKKLKEKLNTITKKEYYILYDKEKHNPGTLNVYSDSDAVIQFVPSDRYSNVSEEKSKELIKKYGKDIVEKNTQYIFNNEMVNKYSKVLTKLIMESEDIDEEDKFRIIDVDIKYNIKKGSINNPPDNISTVEYLDDIKPVFSNKNAKLK